MSDEKPTFWKITGLSVFQSDIDLKTQLIEISDKNYPRNLSAAGIGLLWEKSLKKSVTEKSMTRPAD